MKYSLHTVQALKEMGHRLLDEYVSLDRNKSRVSRRAKVNHAYEKLAFRTGRTFRKHHFSEMETKEEVIEALIKLGSMIKRRKKRNDFYGYDKVQYAPRTKP